MIAKKLISVEKFYFYRLLKTKELENLFRVAHQNRKILYKFLSGTPKEQLLKIPYGFRNNIWWNIAHVVVTQQLLVYKLSGLTMSVSAELVEKFRKGSVPDGSATEDEIEMIKALLFSTAVGTEEDYEKGLFKEYQEYTTSANVTLTNVEDALSFNLFHEGLHLGVILSLQKALQTEV